MNIRKHMVADANTLRACSVRRFMGLPWVFAVVLGCASALSGAVQTSRAIPLADDRANATAGWPDDVPGIHTTADGVRLPCGYQQLAGCATPRGLWIESTRSGATNKLQVVATALGRGLAPLTALAADGKVSLGSNLVQFSRPGLTEEYSVSVAGVRQDFVVVGRLPGTGELRLELSLTGARVEAVAPGATLTFAGSGRSLSYGRLRVEDAAGRELPARLEVTAADRLVVFVDDAEAEYPVRIDPTFSDVDWISLNPGFPGVDGRVNALAIDGIGNLYVGGAFTLVGNVPATNIAKWDGHAWSALGSGTKGAVYALKVSGADLYVGGKFASAGGLAATNIAKWNGSAWSALGAGLGYASGSCVYALEMMGSSLYAGGIFTAAGAVSVKSLAKWDGSNWSAVGNGVQMSTGEAGTVKSLAVIGTNLYVAGSFQIAGSTGITGLALWNGNSWSKLGSWANYVETLVVSGTTLYVGGGFGAVGGLTVNSVAKWDGSAWSALGAGINNYVYGLAVNGADLYVGGFFTTAGGLPATNIARWNGSAWSALGSGINYPPRPSTAQVYALAASGGSLYAGGRFVAAGGVSANGIARWDGGGWSGLGVAAGVGGDPFTSNRVGALAVANSNLYAGGGIATAGGVPASCVARWDGNSWSALGSGLGSSAYPEVYAMAASGSNLYVGGGFETAGGIPATNIARWDGSSWSALGSGMNGWVRALAISGSNLYAGGVFTMAGGIPAANIARWDGATWSALGSGMSGAVYALVVSGPNLYAGGSFATAGGVSVNCIAKWDGSAWSALATGVAGHSGSSAQVLSLAVNGAELYAAGWFATGGATNIARWYGGAWSALGAWRSADVSALLHDGSDLFAAGWFSTASGSPVNYLARWDGSAWSSLGSGLNSAGLALAADSSRHLFVGGVFYQAGDKISPLIAQANMGAVPAGQPPLITVPPANVAASVGATVDFQVAATGSPPLAYQWSFNGTTALAGATADFLRLVNVRPAHMGSYCVIVTNLHGAVTSAPALLAVTGVPPVVVTSPASLVVASGAAVEFRVEAAGTPPLAYQWLFNGTTPIAGATNEVLSLPNVQLSQAGSYSAKAINLYGAVTSSPAMLQVFPAGIVSTASEAELRAVMALGGTIALSFDGTVLLSSPITIGTDTRLDGSGHQVTISGNNMTRVFCVNTNVSFAAANLAIARGASRGGSAILNLGGSVDLCGVSFISNTATYGLFVEDSLSPQAGGGAIFNRGGTVKATNCWFSANRAWTPYGAPGDEPADVRVAGGAILNEAGEMCLGSCAFSRNQASGGSAFMPARGDHAQGGAIHNSGILRLDLATFTGNSATAGGGGNGTATSPGGAGGSGYGGAIYNEGLLVLDRTSLLGNRVTGGDGGRGALGNIAYTMDGSPGGDGGNASGAAICNLSVLWAAGSTFASNGVTAGAGGAGGSGGTYVTIGGNGANGGSGGSGDGGALSGGGSLVNCTLAFNSVSGGNGGWGGQGTGLSGIWGNGGNGGDGGSSLGVVSGTCSLTNCTVAKNQGFAGAGGAAGGATRGSPGVPGTSGTARGGTTCGIMANTLVSSNTPPDFDSFPDPKLGPLTNNGGPTLTMALLPGSPAIDVGSSLLAPASDQRGFPRPAGLAPDIGAFEYGSVMPALAISRPTLTGLGLLGAGNASQGCRLLWSSNLFDWNSLATNQFGPDGTCAFEDTMAPGRASRFYRLVMP